MALRAQDPTYSSSVPRKSIIVVPATTQARRISPPGRHDADLLTAAASYNCDTLAQVEKAISIRLDEEAQEALRALTGSGRSQSEAVREAIVELARRGRRSDLAAEAKRLSIDRDDRAEKARVARLMESLRAAR